MKTIVSIVVIALMAIPNFAQITPRLPEDLQSDKRGQFDPLITTKDPHLRGGVETLDSTYHWYWNAGEWDFFSRFLYSYNGNGLISEGVEYSFDGEAWTPNNLNRYTYDQDNNVTELTSLSWDGSTWVNSSKLVFTFDDDGNELSTLSQTWNGSDWENDYMFNYTYGDFNNILTSENSHWFGMWVTGMRHTYTYDENQRLVHRLVQSWDGAAWINNLQILYQYDANGDLDISTNQDWNNDQWEDSSRNLYDYDANHNRSLVQYQFFIGGEWLNYYQFIYTYSSFDRITSLLYQEYVNDEWVNGYRFSEEYDEHQNHLSEVFQVWMEKAWVNQDSSYNFYSAPSAISKLLDDQFISLFPNPVTNTLNIQAKDASVFNSSVSIFSSDGVKLVEEKLNTATMNINVSSLMPGIYFLIFSQDKNISVEKFVKQ